MTAKIEFDGREYKITGTFDEVTEAVNRELYAWPTPGYGTWFNWPPNSKMSWDGKNVVPYLAATDHGDGTFTARGHRSTSCD